MCGNAMIETIIALLALSPFIAGIPLLGKQLDVKQKAYDAARYSVWERTVWRSDGTSNRKHDEDISLEARDRVLGHPRAAVVSIDTLRATGITENLLWRDGQRHRLLDYNDKHGPVALINREQRAPVEVGYWLVEGIAHGDGALGAVERALQLRSLNLNRHAFVSSTMSVGLRPVLAQLSDRTRSLDSTDPDMPRHERKNIEHIGTGALLSDTWSAHDENTMQHRIDDLTTNELIEDLESPGRPLGMQAPGKGQPLYGEGQFGWSPDLRPRSTTLPSAYLARP
jgi:hypothetical protein